MTNYTEVPRWVDRAGAYVVHPQTDAFLADVLEVCRRHGLSISHEDSQGSFIIRPYNNEDAAWLLAASVEES